MFAVWQAHLVAYHVIQKVRQFIVNALARMPSEKLHRFHRADLEKRVSDDCQKLEPLIAHHGTDIINGLILPFLMIGLLFFIDWRLAVVALIPLPLAGTIQFLMMRGFGERHTKYEKIVSKMHQAQLEFLRSIGVMKLYAVDADSYQQLRSTMRSHHKIVGTYTDQMIGAWVSFVTLAQTSVILVIPVAVTFAALGISPLLICPLLFAFVLEF
ncbi:ABC transporter transmembrane domain-containing protein [Vibrio sonorensis]|uniref:ABC transporter transmembrane domain-containing protein n=1 Tax=Vibrio sonorensis TaxID=1004316 RepID=UPI00316AC867